MAAFYKVIAGLGNPTKSYEVTRHNAGFWFLERFSEVNQVQLRDENKFGARVGVWMWDSEPIHLIQPMTYMNNSGKPIKKLADFYKVPNEKILVVHDELDFEPGIIKLKLGGGHGGHNGLRDIITCLGGGQFGRIRIGIGRPEEKKDVVRYVLESATKEEYIKVTTELEKLIHLMPLIMDSGMPNAMNALHKKNESRIR